MSRRWKEAGVWRSRWAGYGAVLHGDEEPHLARPPRHRLPDEAVYDDPPNPAADHRGGRVQHRDCLPYRERSPAAVREEPTQREFSPHARAKKLARAAECLVYSLTPSGVLAENHPKNRGFVGILRGKKCLKRGQKCLRRHFSRRSAVGEWSRGARSMPRVERTAAPVAQPRGVAASPEIACEAIVCVATGWFRR